MSRFPPHRRGQKKMTQLEKNDLPVNHYVNNKEVLKMVDSNSPPTSSSSISSNNASRFVVYYFVNKRYHLILLNNIAVLAVATTVLHPRQQHRGYEWYLL